MTDHDLQFDEVGFWSEIKLEIVKKYAAAYATILAKQPKLTFDYIDGFAGMGRHISKETRETVAGSPLIALDVEPHFSHHYLIDIDGDCVESLRQLVGQRKDATLLQGDCNEILLKEILPKIQYRDFRRALCLLDPRGLHLDWKVIAETARLRTIDLWLNFPTMHINRNVLRARPEAAVPADVHRFTRLWGDDSWRPIAYKPSRQSNLFGEDEFEKARNEEIASAFQERLRKVAGFTHVPPPLAMRNGIGRIVYYLFFASQNETGGKIATSIMRRYIGRM